MRVAIAATTLIALSAVARCQHLIAYDPPPFGPGLMAEVQVPNFMVPGPVPPVAVYPIAPLLPVAPAVVPQPGDSTFDSVAVVTWYSNGGMLATMPTPSFPPAGPLVAPFPIAPAVLAAIGGPATGIAIDPVANVMFLTAAGGLVIGVVPIPGTPVVVPPFAPAFAMGPVSGLEWDGISGTLLSCDLAGNVYQYFVGGIAAAPALLAPPIPVPAGDVAIDKTGLPNPLGVRSIFVAAGPVLVDVTQPAAPPLPSGLMAPCGLAFLPRPAQNQNGGCPCGPMLPVHATNGPMVAGNGAFAITMTGVLPGSAVFQAIDFRYNPALPLINLTGCGLGLPGTPLLMTNLSIANPAGVATWPIPLTFMPAGLGPAFLQGLFRCPADPAGFTLTNTQQLAICGH